MTNFSIVIPTYKRDSDLEACLCSLRKNSRKEHEIIVLYDMNNATKTICDRYAAVSLYDNARRKGTMIRSLWAIINDGIRHAKNAHVMYLNDDCLVMPGWDEIADSYFDSNLQLGLLILKTKGISNNSSFRVVHPQLFPNLVCANYAIINRRAGLFFDEHFFWYHGDSDISLQFARQNLYSVTCTEENMIIHNHRIDDNRRKHDSDIVKNNKDILYYLVKWCGYEEKDKHLYKRPLKDRLVLKYGYHILRYNEVDSFSLFRDSQMLKKYLKYENRGIVVWGTGKRGNRISQMLNLLKRNILYYVDTSESKWEQIYNNKKIVQPEFVKDNNVFIIIAVKNAEVEIEDNLIAYGKTINDYLKSSCIFES